MVPTRDGRTTAASWTSAASRSASCGAWRCTARPPRPARRRAPCAPSATPTCPEGPRSQRRTAGRPRRTRPSTRDLYLGIILRPARRCIRRTQAGGTLEAEITACREEEEPEPEEGEEEETNRRTRRDNASGAERERREWSDATLNVQRPSPVAVRNKRRKSEGRRGRRQHDYTRDSRGAKGGL